MSEEAGKSLNVLLASRKILGIRSMVRNMDIKGIGSAIIFKAQESRKLCH